jgi:hypothetical protein
MDYSAYQKGYYLREINRAIPTAVSPSTIDPKTLKQALGTEDPATMLPPDVRSLMTEFNGSSNAVKADAACRSIPYPSAGMRDPGARTGCGWWYVSDPLTPSIGSYGTWRGPMNPTLNTSVGPGRWVWDPQQAVEIESIKQAARVQSCPDIAFAQMPNIGWCKTTGMAIMTDGAGNPKYPRVAGGDCDPSQIVTDPASCPPPPSPGPSGGGGAGGGAAAAGSGYSMTYACQPDSTGALSPYCLQLVTNTRCSNKGILATSLSSGGYAGSNPTFNTMNAILQQRGFTINPGIVNDGKLALQDAMQSVNGLYQLAARNDGSLESKAAGALCLNTAFDPCYLQPTARGPWDAYASCITEAAAARGYSMNAAILPGRIDMSYWNSLPTWGDVLARLDERKASAHATPTATDPVLLAQQAQFQANAMNDVYGINVLYPPPTCPAPPLP